ncbi:hypothetical protein BUALT_Bualt19G0043400 [Buddleja alternifolia]|uniref:RNase H type-1 domain-containing protein n=1 Tax=Buddleja alternifolia TaxID=168488 RepID=A0AAV6W257_9LAMI|nr:hypothetical protein BUALT_Bualt19G0043400 [Buddleja alternifolia]
MDKKSSSPEILVSKARAFRATYQEVQEAGPSLQRDYDSRWVPPDGEVIKVNFDGAVFDVLRATGSGCIARDSHGECLAWKRKRRSFGSVPEVAEALAAFDAMQLAREHRWRHIQVEGDCLSLINRLRERRRDLSSLDPLVKDILDLIPFFDSIVFSFVRRLGNKPAHLLARSSTEELDGDAVLPPQVYSACFDDGY